MSVEDRVTLLEERVNKLVASSVKLEDMARITGDLDLLTTNLKTMIEALDSRLTKLEYRIAALIQGLGNE